MDAITIREMLPEDLPRVAEIVCAGYRWLAERERYTADQLRYLLLERGSEDAIQSQCQCYRFLVASMGSEVVGTVAFCENEVEKLYVDLHLHRQGIGTSLLEAALRVMIEQGHAEMFLAAFPAVVPFYERMGMNVIASKPVTRGPLAGRERVILWKSLR
jgi:GNAT superfamily N-acetyltransferase